MAFTAFEVEIFANGQASVRDSLMGQSMHSSVGPWEEARVLYIEQAELLKVLQKLDQDDLVVYDVGMGIGTNALCAIHLFLENQTQRNLKIFSFENQLNGIRFAIQNFKYFPFLHNSIQMIEQFLEKRQVTLFGPNGNRIQWNLIEGDFFKNLNGVPAPELIFYDFYSPKACPELWNYTCFRLIYKQTESRRLQNQTTTLFTYSSSTSARSAMILAGFSVGSGVSTSEKRETTVATTHLEQLKRPLGVEWLDHLRRSGKPFPEDCPDSFPMDRIEAALSNVQARGH